MLVSQALRSRLLLLVTTRKRNIGKRSKSPMTRQIMNKPQSKQVNLDAGCPFPTKPT